MSAYSKLLMSIVFLLIAHMKKREQDSIPKTIIKGSGFINADFSFLKNKGKPEIFLFNSNSVVVGFKTVPYLIYATSQLDYETLPLSVRKNIYEVKMLVLQSNSSGEFELKNYYRSIPKWIINFKKIEYLRLDGINLDQLQELEGLPIRHLILVNIKYSDSIKLIEALKKIKYLKYLAHDLSLPSTVITSIRQKNKKLSIIYESEYYEKKLNEQL